ncbi:hypothetical protein OsJ_04183 [Oryza sativa Japonica Group]|uniref:Uncharacterized protein n=1 Tax=Oryza sativa subsp. japonica TaxID=39947 RepID=B9EUU1_ORYSJ|nr:hypothetical protein OsJ_04183 [Oryza sativa Japonica Group]
MESIAIAVVPAGSQAGSSWLMMMRRMMSSSMVGLLVSSLEKKKKKKTPKPMRDPYSDLARSTHQNPVILERIDTQIRQKDRENKTKTLDRAGTRNSHLTRAETGEPKCSSEPNTPATNSAPGADIEVPSTPKRSTRKQPNSDRAIDGFKSNQGTSRAEQIRTPNTRHDLIGREGIPHLGHLVASETGDRRRG